MKNLKKLKNHELWKIEIPNSIETWAEYLIVENKQEAELAQKLLGFEKYKLEYVAGYPNTINIFRHET